MVLRQQQSHERLERTVELRTKTSELGREKKVLKAYNHSGGGREDSIVADGNSWIRREAGSLTRTET